MARARRCQREIATALDKTIATDGASVFCVGRSPRGPQVVVLEGADAKKLKVLVANGERNYVTHGKNVYAECMRLVRGAGPDAPMASFDPASFKLAPCGLLEDSTGLYKAISGNDSLVWKHVRVNLSRKELERGCDKVPRD